MQIQWGDVWKLHYSKNLAWKAVTQKLGAKRTIWVVGNCLSFLVEMVWVFGFWSGRNCTFRLSGEKRSLRRSEFEEAILGDTEIVYDMRGT